MARSDHIVALAESALRAPFASYAGIEFYPETLEKAAVLCSRLARNHALPDGNKRVAFLCLIEFLERNALVFEASAEVADPDEVAAQAITDLAAGTLSEGAFAAWLRGWVKQP